MEDFDTIGQAADTCRQIIDGSVIKDVQITRTDPASGMVVLQPQLAAGLYYKVIEELLDARVENDSQLFVMLREYAQAKKAYDGMKGALARGGKRQLWHCRTEAVRNGARKTGGLQAGQQVRRAHESDRALPAYHQDEYYDRGIAGRRYGEPVGRSGAESGRAVR